LNDLLSILAGIGLAAACGFRVFVPLLALGLASRSGALTLSSGFQWLGSDLALAALGVATVLEIGAYFVPAVDNLLDGLATPAAVVAGIAASAAVMDGVEPTLRWILATIAGGGAAAAVQIPTVLARGASTLTTGGAGNSLVATGELAAASTLSVAMVLLPLLGLALALGLLFWWLRRTRDTTRRRALPEVS
jgi:hypothetical protein